MIMSNEEAYRLAHDLVDEFGKNYNLQLQKLPGIEFWDYSKIQQRANIYLIELNNK